MTAPAQVRAFWAMRRAVCNNALDPSEPVGGVSVDIKWCPESCRFEVEVSDGESIAYSAAPTLEQALLAFEYLDEGESVLIDNSGRALCFECGGSGCEECNGTGAAPSPPHAWPPEGVVV